jgi:hypothetical protein
MKKVILGVVMALTSLTSFGQEIQKIDKVKYEVGTLTISDDRNNAETSKYWSFYVSFQNQKYKYTTDIGSVTFKTLDEFKKFASLMNDMIISSDKDLVVKNGWELRKYDFNTNVIYINAKDGEYTTLNKDEITKLNELVANL